MNKRAQLSPIAQTGLIYMAVRGVIVLLFYLLLIEPYASSIQNETVKMVVHLVVFIIALAFVIGSGKGLMKIGDIFQFRR
jgi:hypothetical protein